MIWAAAVCVSNPLDIGPRIRRSFLRALNGFGLGLADGACSYRAWALYGVRSVWSTFYIDVAHNE
jgi:hypothetical protein